MSEGFSKVAMIGLGYIGLPTAAVMASRGLQVVGVDVNETTVRTINSGNVHIVEPDLDIVVRSVVTTGNLTAMVTPEKADAFLIAVPTPFSDGHKPDISYIKAAVESVASVLEKGNLVILESTSPVGTTEKISQWLSELCPDLKFPHTHADKANVQIAHCPERVLPGHVLSELVNNDRIIGGLSKKCSARAGELYKMFVKGKCISTTARTAELSKLSENAFRDVNIAFANELSIVCDELGISVWELIELVNRHPRVNVLQPGPGVGGHCIAVDPWFIVDSSPDSTRLIRTAREVNDRKPIHVIQNIKKKADRFKKPIIACFGIAFKANIDDLRESPALQIIEELVSSKIGTIIVVEPNIKNMPTDHPLASIIELVGIDHAIEVADIIVGLVDHDEFKDISAESLKDKSILDLRGMWN